MVVVVGGHSSARELFESRSDTSASKGGDGGSASSSRLKTRFDVSGMIPHIFVLSHVVDQMRAHFHTRAYGWLHIMHKCSLCLLIDSFNPFAHMRK